MKESVFLLRRWCFLRSEARRCSKLIRHRLRDFTGYTRFQKDSSHPIHLDSKLQTPKSSVRSLLQKSTRRCRESHSECITVPVLSLDAYSNCRASTPACHCRSVGQNIGWFSLRAYMLFKRSRIVGGDWISRGPK